MGVFENFIIMLDQWGFIDVVVPFFLIFTVVFAVLQKSQILGRGKKNFNVIVALVIALGVIIPHVTGSYSTSTDVVVIINTALPNISLIIIASIAALLLIGVFTPSDATLPKALQGLALIFSIIATIVIFLNAAGVYQMPDWLRWLEDPETQTAIIVILVFGLIIWFITKEPKEKEETKTEKGLTKFLKSLAPGEEKGK